MKRYVEQLLEDIEEAQNKSIETIEKWQQSNSANSVDDFFEPKPEDGIIIRDLFGLEQYCLPEESYLDDEEVKELTFAIIQLWRSHNLYPVFVKNLSKRIKYCLLRDYWDQMVFPDPEGKTDIEMCDSSTCPYCSLCLVCVNREKLDR